MAVADMDGRDEMLKTGGTEDHKKVAASDADLKAIAAIVLSSK